MEGDIEERKKNNPLLKGIPLGKLNVSIVIPAYNAQNTIASALEGCLTQKYAHPYETILVDDGSTDSTGERVKTYPVKYIFQENSGPAKARNTGWKAAIGEVICFTDSDCIPHFNWVSTLLDGFESNDIAAVAGSYDIVNGESFLAQCIHQEIKWRHAHFKKTIRAFGSYNVAIRKDILEQTGGFNESYRISSGEDNDLSYKILKAGYKIVFRGDALVAHHHTEKWWNYLKEQYRHGYWRIKLYKDFPEMSKGDDYTTWKDIIEPPLTVLFLISVLFLWHSYGVLAFFILLVSIGFLEVQAAAKVVLRTGNLKFFYLAWVTFFRAYARGMGMIHGIWTFWR